MAYKRLNITSRVLDKLGFAGYNDEHCSWGTRTLTFSDGTTFRIIEREEDDADYTNGDEYIAHHYYFANFTALPRIDENKHYDLFFIHEMYQCLKECYPYVVQEFLEKCKKLGMYSYIEAYIKYNLNKINNYV